MPTNLTNRKVKDSSAKTIFGDSVLCAQFLRGYVDVPALKNVQPEDIEDVTERYVHMFTEERDSDVVKRIYLRKEISMESPAGKRRKDEEKAAEKDIGNTAENITEKDGEYKVPLYIISLVEHKSHVEYNVVMQLLRYMVFIWEDYEKEMEKKRSGISKLKGFRYPAILPIVFYDGSGGWTAAQRLCDRVELGGIPEMYIPDYRYLLVQLKDITNADLAKKNDELSVVMMMDKLESPADFRKLGSEIPPGYLQDISEKAPQYLLNIIAQVAETILGKMNIPEEELEAFTKQIKERQMGQFGANFKGYDVQAARIRWKREGEAGKLISQVRKKIKKNMTIPEIADLLEEDIAVLIPIYNLLLEHPDWEDSRICDEIIASGEKTAAE